MADVLARRSARAKPLPVPQQYQFSATSSNSSRAERNTRAFAKNGSPQKSTESASLSSEPPEDAVSEEPSTRRRSTRARDEERERHPKIELLDMAPASDDQQEDDEAVRCICNHDDYPGPPPFEADSKYGLTDAPDFDRIFGVEITDEMAGNFVQCETCNSWQHSACVGFTTEESQPDDIEYFCEQCRKDLHRVFSSNSGQKYSIFLPVHRLSRAVSQAISTANETAGSHSPKETNTRNSRSAAAAAAADRGKRRSTMNSRDAAYDEEEQLRRAIEASKGEPGDEDTELTAASRRPKRIRDDSEEKIEGVKRQRTDSRSASPTADGAPKADEDESDDDAMFPNGSHTRSRNTVRNQRERAERDERREEQERKRAEAANKRKGRAERRRGDEDDPSDEAPTTTRAGISRSTESAQPADPPPSSAPPPDSPPTTEPPASSHKRKVPSQPKKKGRNQYTKDRDQEHEESPARSVPRELSRNGDESTSHYKNSGNEPANKQGARSKGAMNSRVTMGDMKRRVNNILEYMSRTQVDLVNEPLHDSNQTTPNNELANGRASVMVNGGSAGGESPTKRDVASLSEATFRDLSCVEMMDALTRDLVKWQQEYAP
ncbi:PHD-finger [Microdochium nivale]|nr:PHD-finger [Microdochium nivale]